MSDAGRGACNAHTGEHGEEIAPAVRVARRKKRSQIQKLIEDTTRQLQALAAQTSDAEPEAVADPVERIKAAAAARKKAGAWPTTMTAAVASRIRLRNSSVHKANAVILDA